MISWWEVVGPYKPKDSVCAYILELVAIDEKLLKTERE